MKFPKVVNNDYGIRPAGPSDACFYCHSKIGQEHGKECVVIHKKVRVRAVVEYEIKVPHSWSSSDIEFRYNEGTWCADNVARDIQKHIDSIKDGGCLCGNTKVEYLETTNEVPTISED